MKVEKKMLDFWKQNLDHGDKQKLCKLCGVSSPTMTMAFDGEASEDVIIKTNEFFLEKKKRVAESFNK